MHYRARIVSVKKNSLTWISVAFVGSLLISSPHLFLSPWMYEISAPWSSLISYCCLRTRYFVHTILLPNFRFLWSWLARVFPPRMIVSKCFNISWIANDSLSVIGNFHWASLIFLKPVLKFVLLVLRNITFSRRKNPYASRSVHRLLDTLTSFFKRILILIHQMVLFVISTNWARRCISITMLSALSILLF